MKRSKNRKIIPWFATGLVAAMLAALPAVARQAASGPKASILTARVQTGTIENTLAGGGTLEAESPQEVKIPDGVEITEFLVENGDRVEAGQPIAKVDRVTLLASLMKLQESMDSVAEAMRKESESSAATGTLTAQAAGRVKAVWAHRGDDVRQVMTEHGALAVISLDGMMKTEIHTTAGIRPGDKLLIRLSDGSTLTGRVDTELEGKLTILLTDQGTRLGESVTVLTETGEELGEGSLSVNRPWNVVAADGKIVNAFVQEENQIYSGGMLFSIDELGNTAKYQSLAARHREFEDTMQELFAIYDDDCLKAPCTGFVSGIDKSILKKTAASANGVKLMLLADEEPVADPVPSLPVDLPVDLPAGEEPLAHIFIPTWYGLVQIAGQGQITFLGQSLLTGAVEMTTVATDPGLSVKAGDLVLVDDTVSPAMVKVMHLDGIAALLGMMGSFDMSGMLGMGGLTGVTGMPAAEEQQPELEKASILSVTPDDSMTIHISVDELDILAYQEGMQAEVIVDAIPDRTFEAEVTGIDAIGENTGGSSKFQVKLTLTRAPDMLDGMNASVIIHCDSRSALLLPAEAIHDRGSRSFVYTAVDSKTGQPMLEVPVETGISDGKQVEIISGIAEDQPVFYEYYSAPEGLL